MVKLFARSNITILSLEALVAGFYIVITRSLAPVFFAVMGMPINDIVKLNLFANLVAVGAAWLCYTGGKVIVYGRAKAKLLLFHGTERIAWGLIPIVALAYPYLLYPVYAIAMALTVPTGIAMNTIMMTLFSEEEVKKLFAYRSALGAVSSIVGQITMIVVLAVVPGLQKYVYLYLLAMGIGLIATLILGLSSIGKLEPRETSIPRYSEELIKASTAFLFLSILLASGAILGVVWGPYIINELKAPEYLAVAIGFVYTIVSIGASIFWTGKRYTLYRFAIAGVAAVPILILFTKVAELHLAIAAIYAFTNTGANFLASFVFAEVARRIDILRASTMLTAAWSLSQVLGLGVAYVTSSLGMGYLFVSAMVFVAVATLIAFLALPEVALVAPHLSMVYARQLYNLSTASYSFIIFTIRSYVVLTVKLLALSIALLILYMIYRVVYYISILTR